MIFRPNYMPLSQDVGCEPAHTAKLGRTNVGRRWLQQPELFSQAFEPAARRCRGRNQWQADVIGDAAHEAEHVFTGVGFESRSSRR